ncbi:Uncharacterised protein [uncultured archaeon]|nr:Uncharacterised protein [uncultured archaeon]
MKNIDTYLSILEELREIRDRIDKIEKILNLEISGISKKKGFTMAELLDLRAPLRSIVLELTKSGNSTSSDLSARMGIDEEALIKKLDTLKEMGYVNELVENGEKKYEVVMAGRQPRKVPLDIWSALEKKVGR